MHELDGVDFAILMAFAAEPLVRRQHVVFQSLYLSKLRTTKARNVLNDLVIAYGKGSSFARFVRRIAGISESFP